ncbi:hypothetical protein MINTM015_36060 [Mycobacterium paraintracellulare]|nr:hypothetical protein MINTM015_36060 [Mycobacterium paraintracellulare]
MSSVLTDAGERMAGQERAHERAPVEAPVGVPADAAAGSSIDVSTKVVIPPVASLALA